MWKSIINPILFLTISLLGILGMPQKAWSQSVCRGTDFWVAIPYNTSGNNSIEIKLVSDVATTGTITSPAGLSVGFSVSPGSPFTTIIPSTYAIATNQTIGNWGIHIVSNATISAFAATIGLGGGDAINIFPTPSLGTDFMITGYYNLNPTTILVVAPSNGTVVTFTTPCTTIAGSPANTPFSVTLNQGQTYMVRASCDLTRARVTSNNPIQVFSHSRCSQVPTGSSYCDVIWTNALPTNYWNTEYVTGATGGRNGQDRFRVIALNNSTQVFFNGTLTTTLNAGQFYETVRSGGNVITASDKIFVTQFALSNSVGGSTGDPSMVQLLPSEMFSNIYRFTTLEHSNVSSHYLTIVTKSTGTASVRLNGAPLAGWNNIGASGWAYRNGIISPGEYTLIGDSGMHAILMGWGGVNSYGTSLGGSQPIIVLPGNEMDLRGEYIPGKGNYLNGVLSLVEEGSYEIERSRDAIVSDVVYPISIQESKTNFNYLDEQIVAPSTWYYRIRHRDLNGVVSHGNWVVIQAEMDDMHLATFPNPSQNELQVSFTLKSDANAYVQIMDGTGKLVYEKSMEGTEGMNTLQLDDFCADRPAGFYLLKLTANGVSASQTFIHN